MDVMGTDHAAKTINVHAITVSMVSQHGQTLIVQDVLVLSKYIIYITLEIIYTKFNYLLREWLHLQKNYFRFDNSVMLLHSILLLK